MKRMILTMTTAIALALPAAAQDDLDETVLMALQDFGYAESNLETLSEAERVEIYTTATSEDASDVRFLLSGMDLVEMDMDPELAAVPMNSDTRDVVMDALMAAGYGEAAFNSLTQSEVAEIYLTATGEEQTDLGPVLDGMNLPEGDMMAMENEAANTDANMQVMAYLQENGYTEAEIANISEAEMTEIFLEMNSGDDNSIQEVIQGAINS